jgi:hypothetical protein
MDELIPLEPPVGADKLLVPDPLLDVDTPLDP